jgi:hypothetical protein
MVSSHPHLTARRHSHYDRLPFETERTCLRVGILRRSNNCELLVKDLRRPDLPLLASPRGLKVVTALLLAYAALAD